VKDVTLQTLNDLVERGVIQLTRGKIISKKDIDACPGNYPIYSSAKENDGKFGEYGKFLFDEELITWSVDGGGRLFHRPKHRFSVTNVGGVLRILDKSILEYRYLYYALTLRHSEISFDWVKKAHPSVIRRLYTNIPIPSLSEQQRIINLLDEAFEALATAKANAEQNLQNARALFESHLESVFGQRDEEWVETTLEHCCEQIFAGGDVPKDRLSDERTPEFSVPIYSNGEKHNGLYGFTDVARVTRPSITVSARGTLGFTAIRTEPFLPVVRLIVLVPDETQITLSFLYYAVTGMDHGNTGTSIPQLTVPNLKTSRLHIPPLSEQKRIVEKLNALSDEVQQLTSIYERKLAALEELKTSLLHQAFNGEL
jgi:restriction endonuclease S subunit